MFMKKLIKSCMKIMSIAAGTLVLSMSVHANPMSVVNWSNSTVSVIVNGTCSTRYGNISSMASVLVETTKLKDQCGANASHCYTQLIDAPSCNGSAVAAFYFNTKTGTPGEGSSAQYYLLSIKENRVTLKHMGDGPALKT